MGIKKTVFIISSFIAIYLSYVLLKNYFFRPDLTVIGYISEADGLGRQSADLIDIFRGHLRINFFPTRKERGQKLPKRFLPHLSKKNPNWGKVLIFEDMLWRPGKNYYRKILASNRNRSIRIAYSVWESTQLPPEWVAILNEHFDACIVPSPFLIEVYKNSGVSIPIFELPLGLNLESFLREPLKTKQHEPFVFGNLSACSERKNQLLLVKAFAKAFGNDPNVILRINSRYGEEHVIQAVQEEIDKNHLKNVIFTQKSLSKEEYLELFKTIDCYVSPSMGEGFSIQPREAMALGIPVIATRNTGQTDICDSGLVLTLETPKIETAIFPWGDQYGHFSNCSEQDLIDILKRAKDNYSEYLAHANASREWAKKFHFQTLKSFYVSLISPKQIELSSKNQIALDKLMTTSEELFSKYEKCVLRKGILNK